MGDDEYVSDDDETENEYDSDDEEIVSDTDITDIKHTDTLQVGGCCSSKSKDSSGQPIETQIQSLVDMMCKCGCNDTSSGNSCDGDCCGDQGCGCKK
jgi:hypothetical protein